MFQTFKNIQPKELSGFAIALILCLILEPYPLYLVGSLRPFELSHLGLAALTVLLIVAYSRARIENRISLFFVLFALIVSSLYTLSNLITFGTFIIMYFSIGSGIADKVPGLMSISSASLCISFFSTIFIPKSKEQCAQSIILCGAFFPFVITLIWSALILCGNG